MQIVEELIKFGRAVDERITRLENRPTGKAGEKAELRELSGEFIRMAGDFLDQTGSKLIDSESSDLCLGQFQELLKLISRIGRALKSGLLNP